MYNFVCGPEGVSHKNGENTIDQESKTQRERCPKMSDGCKLGFSYTIVLRDSIERKRNFVFISSLFVLVEGGSPLFFLEIKSH